MILSVISSGADRETVCEVEKPAVVCPGKPMMLTVEVTHPSKTAKGWGSLAVKKWISPASHQPAH